MARIRTAPIQVTDELIELFEDRVDRSGTCHIWTGARDKDGYGFMKHKKKQRRAHRIAFTIENGPIPEGQLVLHKCDNPPCVNPEHLFLGLVQDNSDDMVNKNRQARGEGHGRSKLTEDEVREIRDRYIYRKVTLHQLAEEYGVYYTVIHKVVTREIWASVE